MKNKYYNIFLTSEKDGTGKSFRISSFFIFITFIMSTVILTFSYLGFSRVIGQDKIMNELSELRSFKYVTSNLLVESGLREENIKSDDIEKIIIDYIISNNMIYPEDAPVEGYVTKGIVKNRNDVIHAGIDIASKFQDKVKSPLPGIVIFADKNNNLGNTIILHHQNNFFTIYGYLDTILVKVRDLIGKNQIIGQVGGEENSSPHLYFEIWKDNQVIDPRSLIEDYKEKDVSIR